MFFILITNYLTNIGSTCQGITIYDIIIKCKNKLPPPPQKKQFGGYGRKKLPIQISFKKNGVNK
jgi:hypothetical protein